MNIELKKIKYSAFASEETSCFTADIFIDGKKVGSAENAGKGGATLIYPHGLEKQIDDYAKTLPLVASPFKNEDGTTTMYPQDAEGLIDDLLHDHLEAKTLKRMCAKKTLFRVDGKEYAPGEYQTVSSLFSAEIKARLIAKYGPCTFVNEKFGS